MNELIYDKAVYMKDSPGYTGSVKNNEKKVLFGVSVLSKFARIRLSLVCPVSAIPEQNCWW